MLPYRHCPKSLSDKRILVVDGDYQRGGISGRFFPDVIESFGNEEVAGTTLFHKFQQLYSGVPVTPELDRRRWNNAIDVVVADPRLSTVSVDKLPSTNNIRSNNLQLLRHLAVIRDVLRGFDDQYDYTLIDSHPEVSDVLKVHHFRIEIHRVSSEIGPSVVHWRCDRNCRNEQRER
jgi:chromosome partitioning protein